MTASPAAATLRPAPLSMLWRRELATYPATLVRYSLLGLIAVVAILLYYQYYLVGGLATSVLRDYHMTFTYYINLTVIGYILGALASYATGLIDRYGRANVVVIGLFATSLLCLFGIPNAGSKLAFGIVFTLIGVVEGVVLVATPALVRDFSPQLGRATAMAFWATGPVLGSLVVSQQISHSANTVPWKDHYTASGLVGVAVALVALVGLRELTPALRDQLMVRERDRALIEAKARGIDVEASLRNPFRQMLKPDIFLSAFAIIAFLLIYVFAVAVFPIYFQTVFGFTQSKANDLGNWMWAFDVVGLMAAGILSDLILVRKPFMLFGAIGTLATTAVFALRATHPETSYHYFVVLLAILATFLGITYAPWMAAFTETAERRNPALVGTGLAVWGLIARIVVAVAFFFLPHVVTTVTTLVDDAPGVQALAAGKDPSLTTTQNATIAAAVANPSMVAKVQTLSMQYQGQLTTAAKLTPATQTGLATNPTDPTVQVAAVSEVSGVPPTDVAAILGAAANPQALASLPPAQQAQLQSEGPQVSSAAAQLQALAQVPPADLAYLNEHGKPLQDKTVQAKLKYLQTEGPAVKQALADSPKQWQKYWWVAAAGQVVFIGLIFVMAGYWNPRRSLAAMRDHEAEVDRELAALTAEETPTA